MMFRALAQRLPVLWYRPRLALSLLPLLPFAWLFRALVRFRRAAYRRGMFESQSLPVPVIVVGNITVGGSGKTPFVLWLVEQLRKRGWNPGIISRGYGGKIEGVGEARPDAKAGTVGDEPLLLARRSGVPVFVGRDRLAAGLALLAAHPACNVIVSDDGLQHYRLRRGAEIVVFDARGAGNGQLLPAGPLREPVARLGSATAIVWNGVDTSPAAFFPELPPRYVMRLSGKRFISLNDERTASADDLRGKRLYAVAGIGHPERFFAQLRELGLDFQARAFPDHHQYTTNDFAFAHDGVLLLTEKDAVKCSGLIAGEAWALPVDAEIVAAPGARPLLDRILENFNDGRTFA
ncbi:tetraacyldisaccharide 4'-kinase [Propionivibrio soli]|uniref:tetraacyldisaccharide 4'-kinase n=1 Tax=Propionivibrio soli TaxID=2976531 RepID=UPI003083FA18